jgi:hypothetical protein
VPLQASFPSVATKKVGLYALDVELELEVEIELEVVLAPELEVLVKEVVSEEDDGLVVSVTEVVELEDERNEDEPMDVALLLERPAKLEELEEPELAVELLPEGGEITMNAMKADPRSKTVTIAMRMPLETIVRRQRKNPVLGILRF